MRITNKEHQCNLDKSKYEISLSAGSDFSGEMAYCDFCEYQIDGGTCTLPHENRVLKSQCAKADNKRIKQQYGKR